MSFTGEKHTVDTYVSLERVSLSNVLDQFSEALSTMGATADSIREWRDAITVESFGDDGRDVFSPKKLSLARHGITVRSRIIVWTPRAIPQLRNDWVQCGIFFPTDDVCEWKGDGAEYRPQTGPMLWSLVTALATVRPNSGVFVENEAQDGQSWEAQLKQVASEHTFGMALVPRELIAIYEPLREHMHAMTTADGELALVQKVSWPTAPWFK